MLVGIHQPHYLPWLRYIEKIARSDVFIILDDVQYEKNGFQNRNRIKTPQGWSYLTVPIARPHLRPIRETIIDNTADWREKHRRSLEMSYARSPYFQRYWPPLLEVYAKGWTHLADLNVAMLRIFLDFLGIRTRLHASSEIPTEGRSTQRLIELCRAVGGDSYLSGAHAAGAYLDPDEMERSGLRVVYQRWRPPEYAQPYPAAGFIPDLSIVDLLFQEGERSLQILLDSGGLAERAE